MEKQFQEINKINEPQKTMNNTIPVTVKQWLLTLVLMAIPIVNIVLLFVWAFDNDTNLNKKNFAKASLIFAAILIVIWIIIGILMVIIGISMFSNFSNFEYYNTILF